MATRPENTGPIGATIVAGGINFSAAKEVFARAERPNLFVKILGRRSRAA